MWEQALVLPPYETGPALAPPSAPIILSVKWVQALKTGGFPWSCHLQDLNSSGTENSGVPRIMLFWLCVRELPAYALHCCPFAVSSPLRQPLPALPHPSSSLRLGGTSPGLQPHTRGL